MFKHTHTHISKRWLIKMKDTYEIYEVNIIFFILKNNDFFSVSGRSYAIGNCAIIKEKYNPKNLLTELKLQRETVDELN